MGCIETIRLFLYDFRNIELTDIVPNIVQIRLGIDEAIDLIDNLDDNDRATHYEKCEKHFEQLRDYVRVTNAVRDEATKRLMKERSNTRFILIGAIAAAISATAAVLALIFS